MHSSWLSLCERAFKTFDAARSSVGCLKMCPKDERVEAVRQSARLSQECQILSYHMRRVPDYARDVRSFLKTDVTLQVWRLKIRSSARRLATIDWTETVWRDLLFQALTPAFRDCADLVIQQEHDISLRLTYAFVFCFSVRSIFSFMWHKQKYRSVLQDIK